VSQAGLESPQIPAQPAANGLGIAGFICSLVGLFTGGLLCPIGLILSLVALGRQPRGFAVAGVILGVIGTCAGLILVALIAVGGLAAIGVGAAAAAVALSEPEKLELTTDSFVITASIESHRATTGGLPASLDELDLETMFLADPWDNAYRYELDTERDGYRITSNGPDGQPDTDDDINVRDFSKLWQEDEGGTEPPPAPAGP
jgi:hypothetical protein